MSASLESLGWGPGYPRCQTDKLVTVQLTSGIRLPVRREIATLTAWLCAETERRGYHLVPGWCWSFACRSIRGYPRVASRHSWGLAFDWNAPKNPMLHGSPGWRWLHDHGRTDMPEWMPPLWKAHGFGWGGDYANRQDAMHLEVLVTPADIARITAGLHSPVGPIALTKTLHVGDRGPIVGHVQDLLRLYSAKYKIPACDPGPSDSNYGVRTGKAVLAFKSEVHSLQVALGGHLTFHVPLDNTCGSVTLGALEYWDRAG